jgi:hypothetical protein
VVTVTTFPSQEALERLLGMGMEEGVSGGFMRAGVEQ